MFFFDPDATVRIGRKDATPPPDVRLAGLSILPDHAVIKNEGGVLTLVPSEAGAKITVNGDAVTAPVQLHHLARVIFGATNVYKVVVPEEAAAGRPADGEDVPEVIDYAFAMGECNRAQMKAMAEQEKRLREEAEAEKRKAAERVAELEARMRAEREAAEREAAERVSRSAWYRWDSGCCARSLSLSAPFCSCARWRNGLVPVRATRSWCVSCRRSRRAWPPSPSASRRSWRSGFASRSKRRSACGARRVGAGRTPIVQVLSHSACLTPLPRPAQPHGHAQRRRPASAACWMRSC